MIIVNQVNVEEPVEHYDRTNRVFCQKYTDLRDHPLLRAADDFVLTHDDPHNECDSLLFEFTTIRTKSDRNPDAITLQLFYHNESNDKPCDEPFFERHYITESVWQNVALGRPVTTRLELSNGDINEGPEMSLVFHLSNKTLLPRNKRLWVSMYATMPHNHNQAHIATNNMMWVTLNHKKGSTPLVASFGSTENMNYHFRDKTDFLHQGFTQWTDADGDVQRILGIKTETFNMAWRLTMNCDTMDEL